MRWPHTHGDPKGQRSTPAQGHLWPKCTELSLQRSSSERGSCSEGGRRGEQQLRSHRCTAYQHLWECCPQVDSAATLTGWCTGRDGSAADLDWLLAGGIVSKHLVDLQAGGAL